MSAYDPNIMKPPDTSEQGQFAIESAQRRGDIKPGPGRGTAMASIFGCMLLVGLVIIAIYISKKQKVARRVSWQAGLFRLYAVWSVSAMPIVLYLYDVTQSYRGHWHDIEAFGYALPVALLPWVLHVVVIYVVFPVFRWVKRGFFPPVQSG